MRSFLLCLLLWGWWSVLALSLWASSYDGTVFDLLMFGVFFYIAYLIAKKFLAYAKRSFVLTCVSAATFFAGQWIFHALQIATLL
ncbi:hypothetical protein [Bacillus fonticola]|uniref:hypothetical protein n=1 Tax=Bacillus fonticola TaxID=2728853 RepID=UPI00147647AB|nr:hypothetical protein [Bacillus fonticola]